MPVEMSYFIIEDNEEKRSKMEKAFALLDIVTPNSICKSAIPFDPFKIMSSTKLTECQNDKQLCPLGALSKRAASLKIGIRKHIVIEDLPLTGPIGNKISGHSIRIKTQDGHVDCALLERWYETPFRFVVQSNRSLENIQDELASKLDVKPFQIAIEYTRELHEDMCSIYNIVLTANINSTQHFLSKFDMYEKRFFGEQPVPCSKEEMSRLASSNSVNGVPKTINWFSPTILSLFFINLFL
uniref:Uncharacterized protein n=1 Tax=Acrobeloides nanus TaxID=290746 RepID=A0A914D5F2_9BILA